MDKKKKILYFSIVGILLLIGVSYAVWQLSFTQASPNVATSACFSLTFEDSNDITLTSAYPLTDEEGRALTPYTFTITNNCAEYAGYEVNLEVLNTTTMDSAYIKSEFNNTVKLVSAYPTTTKTLNNASTAYKLLTGYLDPNEEVTYTLKLWINYNSTTEQSANKIYDSKITIASTYKDSASISQEKCEATYGEGSINCSIIGQADPNNNKCLQVDENGMIIDPYSTMSDSDTPIVCTMEDDYGTSYYLRGNHQDNNVKFANMCWKLMRITGTGGYKLIYNGDLDANGKCTTTSGEHTGFEGRILSLSGNKVYGSSYTKEGTTYTLSDTSTLNWSTDLASIIGKYTCGNTSTSCSNPYYVVSKENDTTGYVLKMGVSTDYALIGTSAFNSGSNSPAYVGYMYNESYPYKSKVYDSVAFILSETKENPSNYYYGDTITYSNGYYYLTNQDGSNLTRLSWADNYESNLVGKYTCRGTSEYNDTPLRCYNTVYQVLDTTTKTNYMIAGILSGGRLAVGTIKLSSDYTDNGDGTYTLNSPIAEKSAMEWYNGYSSFKNYYVCEDYNQTTCNKLYKITEPKPTKFGAEILVSNNYYYGSSFSYTEGAQNPYTLTDTVQFFDIKDSTNKTKLNTHHYTCFNASDNTCQEMYYIYNLDGIMPYYIKLNGNETGPDALNKMVNNNDINVKDSTIKKFIDGWYAMNIKGTEYESKLEDTVFCNDRTIDNLGGWSETGSLSSSLYFNGGKSKYYLKCPNKRDAFTVSDSEFGNTALTYPVGMLTTVENSLTGNYTANKTGDGYWASAPQSSSFKGVAIERSVRPSGGWDHYIVAGNSSGARPSISLKPGTKFVAGGNGTASNPYEVE